MGAIIGARRIIGLITGDVVGCCYILNHMCDGQNMVWFPIEGDGHPTIDTDLDTHFCRIFMGWMTINHNLTMF